MAKYYGKIGYGVATETVPGVWTEGLSEKDAYGDVLRNTRNLEHSDKVNSDINIDNMLSIVADPFAMSNFQTIKYATFMGVKWIVKKVEVQYPRLILTLGGEYNA